MGSAHGGHLPYMDPANRDDFLRRLIEFLSQFEIEIYNCSGYQFVTNSSETHWNRGTVLFVSLQNKMYRLTQEVESQ